MKEKINEFKNIDFNNKPAQQTHLLIEMLESIEVTKRPDYSGIDKGINKGKILTILYLIVEDAIYYNGGRILYQEILYKLNEKKSIPKLFKTGDIKYNTDIGILEIIEYFEFIVKNTRAGGVCLEGEITNGNLEQSIYRLYNLVYPITARLRKN